MTVAELVNRGYLTHASALPKAVLRFGHDRLLGIPLGWME